MQLLSTNIRKLYAPLQPTAALPDQQVSYQELLPQANLLPFIYCYWELKTAQPLQAPYIYQVVADGCMDIYFDLHQPNESFVIGCCKQYTAFPLPGSFHYAGIRFLPAMFPQLFNCNASELSNRSEPLWAVLPELARYLVEEFHPFLTTGEMQILLDGYFLRVLANLKPNPDARLYDAIDLVLQQQGMVRIETGLNTGLSPRQLRRLFDQYIGESAKTFSQIVRFQSLLRAMRSRYSLRKNQLFFDHGYYDQAHFIKQFRTFYGDTPSKVFGH